MTREQERVEVGFIFRGVTTLDYIEVKLPRCTVFLTPAEINQLLHKEPELFASALQRGKRFLRAREARERRAKAIKAGGHR